MALLETLVKGVGDQDMQCIVECFIQSAENISTFAKNTFLRYNFTIEYIHACTWIMHCQKLSG